MRILMLSWEYPPHIVGGLGRHVTELTSALADLGIQIHVVTPMLRQGEPHEISSNGIHIHRVAVGAAMERPSLSFAQEVNQALKIAAFDIGRRVGAFDLIHAHDWLVAHTGIALRHAWHRPLLSTIHATERGRQQGHLDGDHSLQIDRLERHLSAESRRVIVCSQFMANELHTYFDTSLEKISVIPNGVTVQPSPFTTDQERHAFRRRFAQDDQPLVFYVGRIVYEKGLHVLLNAWAQVLAQMPRARLVIAGSGAYLDALRRQAWELGIVYAVHFTGYIADEDRDRLFHATDAAVFPSLYEPFGIVALEAMAARCPVVVTQVGGLSEVVSLHETGLTVYPNNAESLAWGILHTLSHPHWSQQRAANAYHEVRTRFSWQSIAAVTLETYQRLELEGNDQQSRVFSGTQQRVFPVSP